MTREKAGPRDPSLHALFWDYLPLVQCSLFPLFSREKYFNCSLCTLFIAQSSRFLTQCPYLAFYLLGFQLAVYAMTNT